MARQHDIRDAFYEKGKNISEIAREQHIDRKTVRSYINKDDWNTGPEMPHERPSLLDPFKPVIREWLEGDRQQRKKQRHTARRVHTRLVEEHGYTGSYRTVAGYVAVTKKEVFQTEKPAVPLQHKLGEAQVDFGKAEYIEHGSRVSGAYLTVSFPSSNAGFIQLTPGENLECLFEALITIFVFLGGVPAKLWFDNASTVVTKILKNGGRNLTDRFRRFQEHFGFAATFCNPNAGNEKGNVENKVGYTRRNFLVPVPEFASLDEYNQELLRRCTADLDRDHYRKDGTIAELCELDKGALHPLPRIDFDPADYRYVTSDAYGMITLGKGMHRYSSSPKYARSRVHVKITAQTVSVLDESLRTVVTHRRLYGEYHQQRMDWIPYLTQLSRRPGALKYTPVYDMMPDPLRQWVDAQDRSSVGSALALLARLSESTDAETAFRAVSESVASGITDGDSLVALFNRMTHFADVQPKPLSGTASIDAPSISFHPSRYDELFLEGVN